MKNESSKQELKQALRKTDVSGSLPDMETVLEPIQNALYATGMMSTEVCTDVAKGILVYMEDAGFEVRWRQ